MHAFLISRDTRHGVVMERERESLSFHSLSSLVTFKYHHESVTCEGVVEISDARITQINDKYNEVG
jgi:hypothetical protein